MDIEFTETQRATLTALAAGTAEPELIDVETVETLRRWGLVMPGSFELTGMGARYAGRLRGGILP